MCLGRRRKVGSQWRRSAVVTPGGFEPPFSPPAWCRSCSCSHSHCVLVRALATRTVIVVATCNSLQCTFPLALPFFFPFFFASLPGLSARLWAVPALHHLNRRLPTAFRATEHKEVASLMQLRWQISSRTTQRAGRVDHCPSRNPYQFRSPDHCAQHNSLPRTVHASTSTQRVSLCVS